MLKNFGSMMKQAQEMQTKLQEMQERMAETELSGTSGAGMVTAVMNGKGELRGLKLDSALFSEEDKEILEDLIVAAVNDAKAKVDAHMQEETQKAMGGLQLPPGMKLPF